MIFAIRTERNTDFIVGEHVWTPGFNHKLQIVKIKPEADGYVVVCTGGYEIDVYDAAEVYREAG